VFRPENFIYFFTACGFFVGLIFSVINFIQPEDILVYTGLVTLFFYLFIHIVIMNFVDIQRFGKAFFNKDEYEEISEYFVSELDSREKRMDAILLEVDKMNKEHNELFKKSAEKNETKKDGKKIAA